VLINNKLDEKILHKNLMNSLDSLSIKLISAFSLKYKKEVSHLDSPLLRWLDFRYRYVDKRPRKIVLSDKFLSLHLPVTALSALEKLKKAIILGEDINPYQSRGLTLRNDTSGKNAQARTDLLYADWNILHFHLTDEPIHKDKFFSQPADYLLFCMIGDDLAVFIDALPHPDNIEDFSDPSLIETVYRNWPDYLEQFRFKGQITNRQNQKKMSKIEIHHLRSHGVNGTLNFDGKSYMSPGLGVSSACTPSKVTMGMIQIHRYVQELVKMICDESGQFLGKIFSLKVYSPNFLFEFLPDRGLIVYESISKVAFNLPKLVDGAIPNFLSALNDLILHDWAVSFLTAHQERGKS
jgi:hypothetical protein